MDYLRLLDRLQDLDSDAFVKIQSGIPIRPRSVYYVRDKITNKPLAMKHDSGEIPLINLPAEVANAWVQAVLQEAIRSRGWDLHQIDCPRLGNKPSSARIVGPNLEAYCQVTEGQNREEALLSAYLDALGALKNATP